MSAHEQQLIQNLKRMLTEGGMGNFLIVSCGDAYFQFAAGRGETQIYCEAVSNEYLPRGRQLSGEQSKQLQALGFEPPDEGTHNFSRNFAVAADSALSDLASRTLRILSTVYGCAESTALEFQLNLE